MRKIRYTELANRELRSIKPFYREPILESIRQQLTNDAEVKTKNRRPLNGILANFEFVEPLWELRVGEYRVFYDIDIEYVTIRAVRRKLPEQTTTEVTHA